jgi:hypothetical protein
MSSMSTSISHDCVLVLRTALGSHCFTTLMSERCP